MSDIFNIDVYPAQRGDALWIEYGPEERPFRILIDGGITRTGRDHLVAKIRGLPQGSSLDLLVVTHVDLDHIQGVIALLGELKENVAISRVWFNGLDQLRRAAREAEAALEQQGVNDGIALSDLLRKFHLAAWSPEAVSLAPDGSTRDHALPGGMVATVISPDHERLGKLEDAWEEVVEAFGAEEEEEDIREARREAEVPGLEPMGAEEIDVTALAESKFTEDRTVANGSSIALQLRFKGKSVLLLADAHPSVILRGVQALSPAGPLRVDCVKLAHHGSRNNTSRALVQSLRSPVWIFSSDGKMTKHPHKESVARVLHDSPEHKALVFNYRTEFNEMWDDADLMAEHDYSVRYGDGLSPVRVELLGN